MTAKDFNAMGIEFGLMLKEINFDSDSSSKYQRNAVLENMTKAFARVAVKSNSAFDLDYFTDFIIAVAAGERDLVKGNLIK